MPMLEVRGLLVSGHDTSSLTAIADIRQIEVTTLS